MLLNRNGGFIDNEAKGREDLRNIEWILCLFSISSGFSFPPRISWKNQGLESSRFSKSPPDFVWISGIPDFFSFLTLWFWKKTFFREFSRDFSTKKKSKNIFNKNSPKKFSWASWMKFLQFKDNIFKEPNIQRPFWLKMCHNFFYEYFLWKLENSKLWKNMSEIAKKRSLISGKFLL